MRHLRSIGAILAVVPLLLVGVAGEANAFSSYLNSFNNRYGTSNTRLDECGLCHRDYRGGGSGNAFYADFVAANGPNNPTAAFAAIEGIDSDGDGATNIVEIEVLFHPGYGCDSYGDAQNPPADLADYVDPGNPGCGTNTGPVIDVGPLALDFGAVEIGSTGSQAVRARNTGDANLTITSVVLAGSAEFSLQGPGGPLVVAPGAELQWSVSYAPVDESADQGTLSFASDDPNRPTVTVTLDGSGYVPAPVVLDLDIANFQVSKRVRIERDPSIDITVTVKNDGTINGSSRPATLEGVQNGVVVYTETQQVSDPTGGGRSRYTFGPYAAVAAGNLEWTVTIADDDPDADVATATTLVISSSRMAGASLVGASLWAESLPGVDLSGADVRGVDFRACDLSGAIGLASAIGDATTIYSPMTDFRGTGFDPALAGWMLVDDSATPLESSFGAVKALFGDR